MRILYRKREAWIDLSEESAGTEPDRSEMDALRAFALALPTPPERIPIGDDGVAEYVLLENGKWRYGGDDLHYAEYTVAVRGGESPLPWPPPTEEQKAPGRATLVRIRKAVSDALSDWESNDYAAVVQKLEDIEREVHALIEPASKLIRNYVR